MVNCPTWHFNEVVPSTPTAFLSLTGVRKTVGLADEGFVDSADAAWADFWGIDAESECLKNLHNMFKTPIVRLPAV